MRNHGEQYWLPCSAAIILDLPTMEHWETRDYSNAAWTPNQTATALSWNSETFAQNQNANAIRWGTLV